jgi:hypothetical protein
LPRINSLLPERIAVKVGGREEGREKDEEAGASADGPEPAASNRCPLDLDFFVRVFFLFVGVVFGFFVGVLFKFVGVIRVIIEFVRVIPVGSVAEGVVEAARFRDGVRGVAPGAEGGFAGNGRLVEVFPFVGMAAVAVFVDFEDNALGCSGGGGGRVAAGAESKNNSRQQKHGETYHCVNLHRVVLLQLRVHRKPTICESTYLSAGNISVTIITWFTNRITNRLAVPEGRVKGF